MINRPTCIVVFPFLFFFSVLWASPVLANGALQIVEVPSSFNPVGSGARALGMGGAFIAIADDATAASWNPAGLIQLEHPEISMVGAFISRTEDNTFVTSPNANGEQEITAENLNYLSLAFPFTFSNYNMIVALNHQHLYDFNRDWSLFYSATDAVVSLNGTVNHQQEGQLSALGLAYSVQFTPFLSIGVTLNFWDDWMDGNEWEVTSRFSGNGTFISDGAPFVSTIDNFDGYELEGFNGNIGFLWNITGKLILGGVFKTPFTADLSHDVYRLDTYELTVPPFTRLEFPIPRDTWQEELEMPASYGIGISYRFSDQFTLAGDIYHTRWDDFTHRNSSGNKTSPVSGKAKGISDVDPTTQVRLGMEYLIIDFRHDCVWPLRAGLFYDPAPAEGSPDDYFGFSLGGGVAYKRVVFDLAYQFRFGDNVGGSILEGLGFSQDVQEHTFYSSLIIHF